MNGMRSLVRLLIALSLTLGLALALTACGSVSDTAVSQSLGLDCDLSRLLGDEAMCRSVTAPKHPSKVFCYRTLGSIDCYREPNPEGGLALRPEGVAPADNQAAAASSRPPTSGAVPRHKPVADAEPMAAAEPAEPTEKPAVGSKMEATDETEETEKTEERDKTEEADKTEETEKADDVDEEKPAEMENPDATAAAESAKMPLPTKLTKPQADSGAKDSAAEEQPEKAPVAKARRLPGRKPKRPLASDDAKQG